MFDFVSPEYRPFIGVGVLTFLFIAVASVIQKYRVWQAEKMAKAQGLMRGANKLRLAVERLNGLPLPRDVAELCKQEQLVRYQGVRLLFPNFDGLDEMLADAERGAAGATGDAAWVPPALEDSGQLGGYSAGLTAVLDFLSTERMMTGAVDAGQSRDIRERLRTLRAEAHYDFYRKTALEAGRLGDWEKAVKDTLKLLAYLKAKAAPNERGKQLYSDALALYRLLSHEELPPEDDIATEAGIA